MEGSQFSPRSVTHLRDAISTAAKTQRSRSGLTTAMADYPMEGRTIFVLLDGAMSDCGAYQKAIMNFPATLRTDYAGAVEDMQKFLQESSAKLRQGKVLKHAFLGNG